MDFLYLPVTVVITNLMVIKKDKVSLMPMRSIECMQL